MVSSARVVSRNAALAALFTGLVLLCAQPGWSQAPDVQGVHNFGRVTATLFRGAQPTQAGFAALHGMGVSIVVNFRDEKDEITREQREVEAAGMKYVGIPWSGHDMPSDKQVAQFLDLIHANPKAKIFAHCKAGADRTGVMVAAYRIAVQHESVDEAVAEMHRYHYHHFFLPHLERYVKSLPNLLQSDAVLRAYAPPPAVPTVPAVATPAALSPAPL